MCTDTNESKAIAVGNDKERLQRELRSAVHCLKNEFRGIFKGARFSFAQKRLISTCGKFVLQWLVRSNPQAPISYDNQQTNRGTVVCVELAAENSAA